MSSTLIPRFCDSTSRVQCHEYLLIVLGFPRSQSVNLRSGPTRGYLRCNPETFQ